MIIGFTRAEIKKVNDYIVNGFVVRESMEYTTLFTMVIFLFSVLPEISSFLAVVTFTKNLKRRFSMIVIILIPKKPS